MMVPIESAIATVQNSEGVDLLKRRHTQLQAQLALLRASLAARTGNYCDLAQEYL
ncbi:MAG: hypothetical protein K6T90_20700 [Leptolyngbyaceae cyanobacterium HOT.MB2.61]|jgi:hypothetical protein|nr:hypothetical protein [Leptolyngbyaceae cyanobacterium HOT.MB2.61]